MLSKEQVKHDRINLGRLVNRLENVVSEGHWTDADHPKGRQAWVKMQGMAQKIKYARKLLLNVDYYQELDPQTSTPTPSQQSYLDNLRKTLDRLDSVVDTLNQRLTPEPEAPSSYLSLVPIPVVAEAENISTPESQMESSPATKLIPSDTSQRHPNLTSSPVHHAQDLLPSPLNAAAPSPKRTTSFSQSQGTSSLLSASLQTHEELSNELSRMATQLKWNAQHFSDSLDKDKSLIQSASEALEKNYDTMSKERGRLRDYSGKSSGTTWMVFGALTAVSLAWVFMFFVIRVT